jgi:uncharacterized membrane protein
MHYSIIKPVMELEVAATCLLYILILASCNKQHTVTAPPCPAGFAADIRPIINNKCALPDCHHTGSPLGDFTTYAGIKERADNGRLRMNVFELQIMPPANAVSLTDHEKEQLKCWLDNGAQED